MVTGDLVLMQDEVNPVMSAALENGLDVTALHNHFFWEQPRIFYMHVHGMGSAADLAKRVKPAIDLIDGETLADLLKSHKLGVRVEQVVTERVTVDPLFFDDI